MDTRRALAFINTAQDSLSEAKADLIQGDLASAKEKVGDAARDATTLMAHISELQRGA